MTQVAIVGAGPAGLKTATELARNGIECTVLEEHGVVGEPCNCSGLLSVEGSKKAELPIEECKIGSIRGAKIFAPNNQMMLVQKSTPVAKTVDRAKLDQLLAREAERLGAKIRTKTRLLDIRNQTLFLEAGGRGEILKSDIVVGADGPSSKIRNLMNIESGMNDFIHSFQIRASGSFDPDFVELYLGGFAVDFFAWVIPETKSTAKIGIGCRTGLNPKNQFEAFLKSKQIAIDERFEEKSFLIPCRKPLNNIVLDNKLLVGDAAFQTKATSIDFEEAIVVEEDGLIKNLRIGEMVRQELFKTPDKSIISSQVPVQIGFPKSKVKAFSPTVKGTEPALREIRAVLSHPIDEDLYEIILEKGYRIKATASHSVMVAGKTSFEGKKVTELKTGEDYLPVVLKVPSKTHLKTINIIEFAQKDPSLKEWVSALNVRGQRHLVYQKSTEIPGNLIGQYWGANRIPVKVFLEKDCTLGNVLLSYKRSELAIPNQIPITKEFCRLLGYYVAEGDSKKDDKIGLSFGKKDIESGIVADAVECIKSTFNVPARTKTKYNPKTGKPNGVHLSFGGKVIEKLFIDILRAGSSVHEKEVPFIIFNVENALKLEFLKGYLKGDGTIRIRTPSNRKNWNAEISCKTVSRKLASDLILLSLQLGLFPSIEETSSPAREWNGQKIGESKGYKLTFAGKKDLQKLSGIFSERKTELEEFLAKIQERETAMLPKTMIQNLTKYRYEPEIYQEFGSGISAYRTVALSRVNTSLHGIQSRNEAMQFIQNISESKIAFLKINEIRKVKATQGEVFDVEIPETNMFVGGMGPILLHNTGGGIITSALAGKAAGEAIREHLLEKKPLSAYNKKVAWLNKELALHWKIHKYMTGLNDAQISKLFEKAKKAKIEELLSREANMDFPTRFVSKIVSNPRILFFLPEAVGFWRS